MAKQVREEKIRILVVDDEEIIRDFVVDSLINEGFETYSANSVCEAKILFERESPHIVITDVKMPDENGISLIRHIRLRTPHTGFILMTAFPDDSTTKFAADIDVGSFLIKPFTVNQLKYSILKTWEACKDLYIEKQTSPQCGIKIHGLIGQSQYIKSINERIQILSNGTIPILICGESGTGKEIIANALHHNSDRSKLPMFTINCAAIPKHLEESEFFGHSKGAFTGAVSMKHGIVASADKSTLFLDEIAELSLETQAKLLRILDTGEFLRIGEAQTRTVDIRIISATNKNLEEMVHNGTFRRDLYYRLKGATIETKPLKEYREDIPLIVRWYLNKENSIHSHRAITADAMELLIRYDWPGNVRELKHTINHLIATTANNKRITAEAVRKVIKVVEEAISFTSCTTEYSEAKGSILNTFEIQYFNSLLRTHQGNLNKASKAAGMHRPNLIKKLKTLAIDPNHYRPSKVISEL